MGLSCVTKDFCSCHPVSFQIHSLLFVFLMSQEHLSCMWDVLIWMSRLCFACREPLFNKFSIPLSWQIPPTHTPIRRKSPQWSCVKLMLVNTNNGVVTDGIYCNFIFLLYKFIRLHVLGMTTISSSKFSEQERGGFGMSGTTSWCLLFPGSPLTWSVTTC